MTHDSAPRKLATAGLVLALVGVAAALNLTSPVAADHLPADKMAVAGASFDVLTAPLNEGSSSEEHTLLTGTMRTSAPSDLIIQLTSECALWTDVTSMGGDSSSEATARVMMWVEIDGVPVPVASDDEGEGVGEVVFCDRVHGMSVANLNEDGDDAEFRQYLRTRTANAFNWITTDVGAGVHELAVKARLEVQVDGVGEAQAGVGKRTLVVEPVKLANDVSV